MASKFIINIISLIHQKSIVHYVAITQSFDNNINNLQNYNWPTTVYSLYTQIIKLQFAEY